MVVDRSSLFLSPPRALPKAYPFFRALQFIIEGLLTFCVGCVAPWFVFAPFVASRSRTFELTFLSFLRFVHDFPTEKPRFLTVSYLYRNLLVSSFLN